VNGKQKLAACPFCGAPEGKPCRTIQGVIPPCAGRTPITPPAEDGDLVERVAGAIYRSVYGYSMVKSSEDDFTETFLGHARAAIAAMPDVAALTAKLARYEAALERIKAGTVSALYAPEIAAEAQGATDD